VREKIGNEGGQGNLGSRNKTCEEARATDGLEVHDRRTNIIVAKIQGGYINNRTRMETF